MSWLRYISFIFTPLFLALIVIYFLKKYGTANPDLFIIVILSALMLTIINGIIVVILISRKRG
jgi:hypothetical protein